MELEIDWQHSLTHWSVKCPWQNSDLHMCNLTLRSDHIPHTGDDKGGTGQSVLSLYIIIFFTIGHYLRIFFKDSSKRVIYEEVPDTALLLDLCDGVYIARNQGDLPREYKLYHELIRIFRSPELLAKITQPKSLTSKNTPCLFTDECEHPNTAQGAVLRQR